MNLRVTGEVTSSPILSLKIDNTGPTGSYVDVMYTTPWLVRYRYACSYSPCSYNIPSGSRITLTAYPVSGAVFKEWGGDRCVGSSNVCSFSMGPYSVSIGASFSSAQVVRSAPPTPTGLKVTATSSSSISLAWIAYRGATGTTYKIYRSGTLTGTYLPVRSGITAGSYTDAGLKTETTYYYKVSAVSSSGIESAQTSAVSGRTSSTTAPNLYTLSVTIYDTCVPLSGFPISKVTTATGNPAPISCTKSSGPCAAGFPVSFVSLNAVPGFSAIGNDTCKFIGWGADCAGSGLSLTANIYMDRNHICSAKFISIL